jgi:hypothetical protein
LTYWSVGPYSALRQAVHFSVSPACRGLNTDEYLESFFPQPKIEHMKAKTMSGQFGNTTTSISSMRKIARNRLVCRTFSALLCCVLMQLVSALTVTHANAVGPSHIAEPSLSLETRNEPLGQVLAQITQKTAYRFSLEDAWMDHPVTVAFRDLPLSQGLKRVLSNLNHAVVYESQYDIRIIIFGEAVFQPAGSSPAPRPVPVPIPEDIEQETPELESPEPPAERFSPDRELPRPPESDDAEGPDEDEADGEE